MSKHKMVNGKLLQMNKSYKDLKNRQKDKIAGWMYEAYKKQINEGLSNDEAFALVMDKINEAQIWVPEYEVEQKFNSMKNRFKNRLAAESIPQRIYQMEEQEKSRSNRFNPRAKSIIKKYDNFARYQ